MNQNRFYLKRTLGLLAFVICGLTALAQPFEVDGIFYNIESPTELTVSVTKNANKYSGRINIPSEVFYDNKTYRVISIGIGAFRDCPNITSITIPNTIVSIGETAFWGCTGLKNISIPESVTSIGAHAFYKCNGLITISLPSRITVLWSTFEDCSSLSDIIIPDSVSTISGDTFSGCRNLSSITIGKSVKYIGMDAFWGCSKLKTVNICDLSTWLKVSLQESLYNTEMFSNPFHYDATLYINGEKTSHIIIPESVDSIGDYVLDHAQGIKSVIIHNKVKHIGICAFQGTSIEELVLPNSVISIGEYAFNCPYSLKYLSLGENIDMSKCSKAFYGSFSISKIRSHIKNPSHMVDNIFSSDVYKNAQLIVPDGCLEKYLSCDGWMNFMNIVEESQLDGFSLKITAKGNGSVSYLNSALRNETKKISVKRNQSVTLALTPDDGYEIKSVLIGGKDVTDDLFEGTYTIAQIKEDIDFVVEFAEKTIFLSIQHADNGRILQKVEKGKTYEYKIVPNSGWKIHSITFNGEDITSTISTDGMLVTPLIDKDATLNITFEEISSSVRSERNSPLTVTASGNTLNIQNAREGELIEAFTVDGNKVMQTRAIGGKTTLKLPIGRVYIIKGETKTIKVGL